MQTAASDNRLNTKLTTDILSLKGREEGSHYVGSSLTHNNEPPLLFPCNGTPLFPTKKNKTNKTKVHLNKLFKKLGFFFS